MRGPLTAAQQSLCELSSCQIQRQYTLPSCLEHKGPPGNFRKRTWCQITDHSGSLTSLANPLVVQPSLLLTSHPQMTSVLAQEALRSTWASSTLVCLSCAPSPDQDTGSHLPRIFHSPACLGLPVRARLKIQHACCVPRPLEEGEVRQGIRRQRQERKICHSLLRVSSKASSGSSAPGHHPTPGLPGPLSYMVESSVLFPEAAM